MAACDTLAELHLGRLCWRKASLEDDGNPVWASVSHPSIPQYLPLEVEGQEGTGIPWE